MDIQLLRDDRLEKEYNIIVSMSFIMQNVKALIAEKAKTFKLAGFREGKVPLSIVEGQVGSGLMSKEVDRIIYDTMQDIITKNSYKLLGKPHIEVHKFELEKNLEFKIVFYLMPNVPEIDFNDENFSKLTYHSIKDFTDEDVKKELELIKKMTQKFAKITDEEYKAKKNDVVVLDFIGKVDGKDFEGNKATGLQIRVGDHQFLEEFENQLISLKIGDAKILKIKFPDDYHDSELAGKDAEFDVKIHEIHTGEAIQELDDAYAKSNGFNNLKILEEALRNKKREDFKILSRLIVKRDLFNIVDELYKVEVPQAAIDRDFDAVWAEISEDMKKKPTAKEYQKSEEEMKKDVMKMVRRRVKIALILSGYCDKHKINVSDQEVDEIMNFRIRHNPEAKQEITDFHKDPNNANKLYSSILEDKMVDHLLENISTIKKVKISIEEFEKKYSEDLVEISTNKLASISSK